MKRKVLSVLLPLLALGRAAVGANVLPAGPVDPQTGNFAPGEIYNYLVPPNVLPNLLCSNFVVQNSFTVNYDSLTANTTFYEPKYTVNYTNTGTMTVNTGFRFDTLTTNLLTPHVPAGTFYNGNLISAGSINDSGAAILSGYVVNYITGGGQILVTATNIINPGTLDVGYGGYVKLGGRNVVLDGGIIQIESVGSTNSSVAGLSGTPQPTFDGVAAVGVDTNADWDPAYDLGSDYAFSGIVSVSPYDLSLINTTAYMDGRYVNGNVSNIIWRAVFVQNDNPNVTVNVYMDGPQSTSGITTNKGSCYVEWSGSYIDPSTGNSINNYLYLNDDYIGSAATNTTVVGEVPRAFNLFSSLTPYPLPNQITPGFYPIFYDQTFTNRYSFMDGNLIGGQTPTNATVSNPGGSLTNLPGRVEIGASNFLSMAGTHISGGSYVSITCSNGFAGSPGAKISAPYSDLALGSASGSMTVSNLLVANIPQWNGPIAAWSTRWLLVTNGITNDFRVLLVYDNVQPVTPPWINNLTLNVTNSLMVADSLNILANFYTPAQSITVLSNSIGVGATTQVGALNLESGASFGPGQVPDLVWLTNNGDMFCLNLADFQNNYTNFSYTNGILVYTNGLVVSRVVTNTLPATWYGAFINNGTITNQGMQAYAEVFTNAGVISAGSSSFSLSAVSATFTNGYTAAGADVAIQATNLLVAGEYINAGRALNLTAPGSLSDGQANLIAGGLTNGNIWVVGSAAIGNIDSGFNTYVNPFNGDLLGTTVTNIAPANKVIANTWAGVDRSYNISGFQNNLAVGHLVLDAGQAGSFTFSGTGSTNSMYVDCLELRDWATNLDLNLNPRALKFANGFNLYYAQAIINGVSVATKLNGKGLNLTGGGSTNHLRWVPEYAGYFSYTNLVYPNGTTNAVNAALAQDSSVASGGVYINGVLQPNSVLPTQIFVPSEINLAIGITNGGAHRLTWNIPATGTNYYVQYLTNLMNPTWLTLTNFNIATNRIPTAATNVVFVDTNHTVTRFYRVVVQPWLTYPN
jgi:hypothetical protein